VKSDIILGIRKSFPLTVVVSFYLVYNENLDGWLQEKQAQRPWPKDRIWVFKSDPRFFGSPMMDAVLNNSPLDKEMVHWLKTRPNVFLG